jgi:hypothetical protein
VAVARTKGRLQTSNRSFCRHQNISPTGHLEIRWEGRQPQTSRGQRFDTLKASNLSAVKSTTCDKASQTRLVAATSLGNVHRRSPR